MSIKVLSMVLSRHNDHDRVVIRDNRMYVYNLGGQIVDEVIVNPREVQ